MNATMRRRLFALTLVLTFALFVLAFRLAYVQLAIGPELAGRAEDSWRRNVLFQPKRGDIRDRSGIPLAYDVSTPTVVAIPAQIRDAEATADKLSRVLGMNKEDVLRQITLRTMSVYIRPGGRKIDPEKAKEVRNLGLPGIVVTEDSKRYYPFGSLAAHVLGIVGVDGGLTGIERHYDARLRGVAGSIAYLSDARGRKMPHTSETYTPPQDGLHLQLTIDKNIQAFVERELDQAVLEHKPKQAIAIAVDPTNGDVLAMASRPTFEPGRYADYPPEIYNRNLPIWMTYEPGSTFKIITLAAALEEKKVDLKNERFHDPGYVEVAGVRLHCWRKGGHGSQTFLEVIENSCNPGFVALGQRLGKETLFGYIRKFGFGQKTGIDLDGEENGILFPLSRVGPVELATTSFGQGVSVTPIQQVMAVSAAVNGGKLYRPRLAKAWIHPETGETVATNEPVFVRQVISGETSRQIREALENVVAHGTGRNAFVDGYRVGGKTGTAQKAVGGRYAADEHIVSFIGVAPANDPKIVVYVAIDDPEDLQFGGLVAAPVVRNILADALPYLGVEPDYAGQIPKKANPGVYEPPMVEVPDLIGATVDDILEDLNMNFRLARYGSGSTVVDQSPKAGTRVERGSTIRIFLADT